MVLNVKLKNTGDGTSEKTIATLKNLSGDDVFLEKGRIELENFRPGEVRSASFRFRQSGEGGKTEFELLVMDEEFQQAKRQKISLPVFEQERPFSQASAKKTVVFRDSVFIVGGTFPGAPTVGLVRKNSIAKLLGTSGRWIMIKGANSVMGWVEEKNIRKDGTGNGEKISAIEEVFEEPPFILISDYPISTETSGVTVEGTVSDTNRIESVSVWRENDKIKLFTPRKNNLPLYFSLDLEEGMNLFTIIAKDEKGMTSRKILAIRKDIS